MQNAMLFRLIFFFKMGGISLQNLTKINKLSLFGDNGISTVLCTLRRYSGIYSQAVLAAFWVKMKSETIVPSENNWLHLDSCDW